MNMAMAVLTHGEGVKQDNVQQGLRAIYSSIYKKTPTKEATSLALLWDTVVLEDMFEAGRGFGFAPSYENVS